MKVIFTNLKLALVLFVMLALSLTLKAQNEIAFENGMRVGVVRVKFKPAISNQIMEKKASKKEQYPIWPLVQRYSCWTFLWSKKL